MSETQCIQKELLTGSKQQHKNVADDHIGENNEGLSTLEETTTY
jgi:hypothetical protein